MRVKFLIWVIFLSLFIGCGSGGSSSSDNTSSIESNPYSTLIDSNATDTNTTLIPPPLL